MRIRTVIVDDEPLARQRLRKLLENEADVEVVGEAADGPSALAAIHQLKPDLLFLDVQIPGMNGFGVLDAIGPDRMPVTIFVTAYDRYALQAFEVHALDYLLKPYDRSRFEQSLRRARENLRNHDAASFNERLLSMLGDRSHVPAFAERLVVKSGGRVFFVPVREIDWAEAAGNYIRLHAGKTEHLVRETMNSFEAKLDPNRFARIHRSTIVNIEKIRELEPSFHGDYVMHLQDGTQLTLSRGYREKVQASLGLLSKDSTFRP